MNSSKSPKSTSKPHSSSTKKRSAPTSDASAEAEAAAAAAVGGRQCGKRYRPALAPCIRYASTPHATHIDAHGFEWEDDAGKLPIAWPDIVADKLDHGKTRWDLLPWAALDDVADVMTYGAEKYAPDGWRKVDNWRERYFAAAMRHLVDWKLGEENDEESHRHHLAHAAACVLFMLELD